MEKLSNKKILVGGYYDDRIFEGESFEGKTPFNANIDVYTVEEALKLAFVENIIENYEEDRTDEQKKWDELSDTEKAEIIEEYTRDDEIAGMIYFETEEEAEQCKSEIIQELEELEKKIQYEGKKQDDCGCFREVYTLKSDD